METVNPSHFHRVRLRHFDPDRMREAIEGGAFDHQIVASPSCSIDLRNWSSGSLQLDRGEYSFGALVRGQFPRGRLCIGMVPRMEDPTHINGYAVSPSNLQVYTEDAELLFRAGPRIVWKSLCIERDALESASLAHLGRPLMLPRSGVVNLAPDPFLMGRLERLTEASFREIPRRPDLAPAWRKRLLVAYIEALASVEEGANESVHVRAQRRCEVLRRADYFLQGRVGRRFSSRDLCVHLGMSERNLQMYFREGLGMGPKKWFQQLALSRAFHLLKASGANRAGVTAVAMECGFEHLGRFSRSYRELFGELPRETAGRFS